MTRGWCPGIHEPMPSGDGLLVRVKPPGGRLPAAALRAIADASIRHGNGVIELTSRGNLQIRGLTAESAPRFADAMVAAGLGDPDPARERCRNVITMPPYDDALAAAGEATLADIPDLASKFCVSIGSAAADLIVLGDTLWAEGRAYPFSLQTLRTIAQTAQGQRLRSTPPHAPAIAPGLLLGLPFGQTDATGFTRLADLTDEARTTPWRAIHVPPAADAMPFASAGFILDPADPRRNIAACPGTPACTSGAAPARADALRLAALGVRGVHVSGCAKGCAHAGARPTLVGCNGRYGLVVNGRAGDTPSLTGLTLEQAIKYFEGRGLCPPIPLMAFKP
jgi:precorrin-3B synthase